MVNHTKQKVMNTATSLFFQKGFHGTSVRDIADKANVNVSLISYYFKNKQGLLEYIVTTYYEAYLTQMEETMEAEQGNSAMEKMQSLIATIIQYKQSNHQLTCFIQRELSLYSVFVSEITVTYLAKENHFLRKAFNDLMPSTPIKKVDQPFFFMQLKGMLITPYVMQHEWKHHVIGEETESLFVKRYVNTIQHWLDHLVTR
ncbi:MAG TPA: forespore capture DNA-binding protein RefZ [Bacillota bacterium]|nr:forespore capture DNA-binding protein RefZ [Bacillota bacterium]